MYHYSIFRIIAFALVCFKHSKLMTNRALQVFKNRETDHIYAPIWSWTSYLFLTKIDEHFSCDLFHLPACMSKKELRVSLMENDLWISSPYRSWYWIIEIRSSWLSARYSTGRRRWKERWLDEDKSSTTFDTGRRRDEYQESEKKEDVRVTMIRLRKRKTRIAVDKLFESQISISSYRMLFLIIYPSFTESLKIYILIIKIKCLIIKFRVSSLKNFFDDDNLYFNFHSYT